MKIPGIPDFDFDIATFASGEVPVWDPSAKTFVGMTVAQALGFTPENIAHKDQASGYAGLGSDSKLSASQLPQFPDAQAIALGASSGRVPGLLVVDTTSAQTDANTTEKTLWSYALAADTLNANGRLLRIRVFGDYGANGNTKSVRLKFDGANLVSSSASSNNEGWQYEAVIVRTADGVAPASVSALTHGVGNAGSSVVRPVTLAAQTINWAISHTITLTGQNGTASAGDVVFRGAIIEVLN